MIDFLLDDNGDISFSTIQNNNSEFQLDFFVSKNSSLLMDFRIENRKEFSYLDNLNPQFIFDFEISKIKYDKDIDYVIDEEDYIYQQIKIRLGSALDTILGNEELGSSIDLYKHESIDDSLPKILNAAKEALYDLLPNAEYYINKTNSNYYDYSDSVRITIQNGNYNYYYYL